MNILNGKEGLFPLIFGHGLTYSGGMAVVLARLFLSKTSSYCDWAKLYPIPKWKLISVLIRSVLKRDVQLISLTVFCFCLTSFSLPLLLGGKQVLEVVIYEYFKSQNHWPLAVGLLSFEILFIFVLSFFIFKPPAFVKKNVSISYLSCKKAVVLGLLPCFVLLMPLLEGLYYIPSVLRIEGLLDLILSSFILFVSVGGAMVLMLVLSSFCNFYFFKKFLIGYGTPNIVLTGFSFLIFFNEQVYFSWILGLVILFFPALYRWAAESFLQGVENQVQTGMCLGAGQKLIFKKIVWPQCRHPFFFLGGIAGFWAMGDFAYTMITSQGESHLALAASQLLKRYRIEQGLALIWVMLFFGSIFFIVFSLIPFFLDRIKVKPSVFFKGKKCLLLRI